MFHQLKKTIEPETGTLHYFTSFILPLLLIKRLQILANWVLQL